MSAIGGIHTLTGCIVDQYMQILAYLNNHAPEGVIIAGLFASFSDRLNESLFTRLTKDERLWAQMAAKALVDTSRISEATPMIKDVVLAVIEINLREKLNTHERIDNERTMTSTLELDALRRAFINHPHYASFETLLRALPTKQALLDRLMISVAARRLEWQVEITTEFSKDPEVWHHRSLTIDMKVAIYRRIGLCDVKDMDPYPKMLKIVGLSH